MKAGRFPPGPSAARCAAAMAVLAVLSVWTMACAAAGSPPPSVAGAPGLRPLIRAGEKAPAFTLKDLDGKAHAFLPGAGKPALLVFWSAFCPLCRELTPAVSDIARLHGKHVRVIGVNLDGRRFSNAVASFIKEFRVPYLVVLDDIRNDLFVASDPYGIEKTPTAVLVDGAGVVRGSYAAENVRQLAGSFVRILSDLQKSPTARK